MAHLLPTKKEREIIRLRLSNPHLHTQAEVIKKLKLKDSNNYYRVFERSIIADRKEELMNKEEAI